MNKRPLYFDYAATTPVDERVIQVMVECLGFNANFGNPASSSHAFGQAARQTVEQARRQVAELVGAQPEQIVWTSGATESNNLAIKGVAQARGLAGGHIITSQIEHKATLDTARQLQEAGVAVTYLVPDADGLISVQAVSEALREDTFLVSLMLVNNELGTLNDIPAIGARLREQGALFHVDAAQGAGKVAIDLAQWSVDLMSFSAHKLYGPKGIARCTLGLVRNRKCWRRFMAAATKVACVRAPWRRIRLRAWARRSLWRRRTLLRKRRRSWPCVNVCWSSWRRFPEYASMAAQPSVFPTPSA